MEQENLNPVNVIAHSMGGTVACLFAGVYPEKVSSLISIEGVGGFWYMRTDEHPQTRIREWINTTRDLAGRVPRKYDSLSEAFQRMQKSNPHLSEERARHLTTHGSNRNEDGTYSLKFDNYTHSRSPLGMDFKDMTQLWEKIDCPTLLMNAKQGFDHRTGQAGTLKHFKQGQVLDIDHAGHWLHHDQFDAYLAACSAFLAQHAK